MVDFGAIRVHGARQHNLKNIDVTIPRRQLTVITGVSGSGKSSLAFDTIFAEGQRRYVESLSVAARQFLEQMPKPAVDRIEGLSPTIAIEQRGRVAGPRSNVATITEIQDYLRVLFARVGEPQCWICGRPILRQSTAEMVDSVCIGPPGMRILILAPIGLKTQEDRSTLQDRLSREGFVRIRLDGVITLLEETQQKALDKGSAIEVVIDRLTLKPDLKLRLAESLELGLRVGGGRVIVSREIEANQWEDETLSSELMCPVHSEARIETLEPQLFNFNVPQGACPKCHGLGNIQEFDPELVIPDRNRSLAEGAVAPWRRLGRSAAEQGQEQLREFCERFGVSDSCPVRDLDKEILGALLHGTKASGKRRSKGEFKGVIPELTRLWKESTRESARQRLFEFLSPIPCATCNGTRHSLQALSVRVGGRNLADVGALTIPEAHAWLRGLDLTGETAYVAAPLVSAVCARLQFLIEVGVEYLTLNRRGPTLSGGEWQRLRLATQIGGGLSGICYVLDEPTVGLHPRDSSRLVNILKQLRDLDNTVIVVEHDEQVVREGDFLIEIGPEAGSRGGYVVAQGSPAEVAEVVDSLTSRFLKGDSFAPAPKRRQPNWNRCVEICGAAANNLKNINVRFPLGCMVTVTGVSGSGKSTLVADVLLRGLRRSLDQGGPRPGVHQSMKGVEHVFRVVEVDQAPIGRSPRSNPASYVGALNLIRELFSKTRESKIRGYGPNRFSFNVKGGRCDHCEGQGTKRISMHFLPDIFVPCTHCGASRYNRETLEIRFRGKSIADVLSMSVTEATVFFEAFAKLNARLKAIEDVGLGYVSLGQPSNTLSGGEAQRIRLAAELHKGGEAHVVYVLDEPTSGLHITDVARLLDVLNRLVDEGHTVIVIEHHLEVIKNSDWVIDLGPEAGGGGGEIVAQGPPEEIAKCALSHTGRYLASLISGRGTNEAKTQRRR